MSTALAFLMLQPSLARRYAKRHVTRGLMRHVGEDGSPRSAVHPRPLDLCMRDPLPHLTRFGVLLTFSSLFMLPSSPFHIYSVDACWSWTWDCPSSLPLPACQDSFHWMTLVHHAHGACPCDRTSRFTKRLSWSSLLDASCTDAVLLRCWLGLSVS